MDTQPAFSPGRKPNLIFAICMILAGIVLFLANLGLLPIRDIWSYWPMVFVAVGLGKVAGARRHGGILIGAVFILLGVLFTLINTGVFRLQIHDGSWPLSLVFLALGVAGLAKVLDGGQILPQRFAMRSPQDLAGRSISQDTSSVVQNFAFMASVVRRVESVSLQGGGLTSFFGSIDLDLRKSILPPGSGPISMDANAILGSIKLRIPEAWRVTWNGVQVMGSFEDKTIPQLAVTGAPQLVLSGYVFMGSIEVES